MTEDEAEYSALAEHYGNRATELLSGLVYDDAGNDRTEDLADQTVATLGVGYALLAVAAELRAHSRRRDKP